jgi:hypothetical protein
MASNRNGQFGSHAILNNNDAGVIRKELLAMGLEIAYLTFPVQRPWQSSRGLDGQLDWAL